MDNSTFRPLLAKRMETLGSLACGIVHDLNNVLTPILLGIETLKPELESQQGRRVLAMMESNARKIADLADQVLAFARGIEGRRASVNLAHLIHDVERTARETFTSAIETQTAVTSGLWPISADPTQIHQVLLNLAVNARDAMANGGRLSLSAQNIMVSRDPAGTQSGAIPKPYVAVTVTDTGCGIPPAIMHKIFEPFFTTKASSKGTGLGLATVASIVRAHDGLLEVESREGRGTQIRVCLPATPATIATQPRKAPRACNKRSNKDR